MDHVFSPKLQAFARYTNSHSDTDSLGVLSIFGTVYNYISNQGLTSGLTWSPTGNLANDLRFNWSTTHSKSGQIPGLSGINLFTYLNRSANDPPDSYATLAIRTTSGNLTLQQGLSLGQSQQFNVVDSFSWTKGSHLFKFGGNFRRLSTLAAPNTYKGNISFANVAAAISGTTSLSVTALVDVEPVFYNYGLFVNDDWKLSNRLSVQLGLRWDVDPVPGAANGLSPTTYSYGPSFSNIKAQPAGTPLYTTKYLNLAPRAGIAYRLGQIASQPMILRLGAGFFYDTDDSGGGGPYGSYPFGNTVSTNNLSFPVTAAQAAPPPTSVPVAAPYGSVFIYDPNLHLPVTYSWSAALEQTLGRRSSITATYVGNDGRKLLQSFYLLNIPNTSNIQYTKNGSNSSYNALQVKYQARLVGGMTAFGSYSYSHSIDDTALENNTFSYSPIRADSDGDQPHIARFGLSYTSPTHRGGRLVSALLSEWGGDLNLGAQSGLPFTLRAGYYTLTGADYQYLRPNIVPGVAQWIQNAKAPGRMAAECQCIHNPASRRE